LPHNWIEGTSGTVPFAWKRGDTVWQWLCGAGVMMAAGRRPITLDRALRHSEIDVLFPIMQPRRIDAPVRQIAWIPDFQHLHFPQYWSSPAIERHRAKIMGLIESDIDLVLSSEAARRDLATIATRRARLHVLPFVTVPDYAWTGGSAHEAVRRHRLPRKFLIFPSQFWQHKNHATLFHAIALLRRRGVRDVVLVTTGGQVDLRAPEHGPRLLRLISDLGISDAVCMLGLLPRSEQIQLLRAATAVIQPSLFEGWSALVEDCRALGKRLYVSDIPVHREQRPEHAVFFPPLDPEALAEAIALAWSDLQPGPDLAAEQRAWNAIPERAERFAGHFLAIAAADGVP
jgi:glycosyltransferase involved in cell wall biosynthesis